MCVCVCVREDTHVSQVKQLCSHFCDCLANGGARSLATAPNTVPTTTKAIQQQNTNKQTSHTRNNNDDGEKKGHTSKQKQTNLLVLVLLAHVCHSHVTQVNVRDE